MLLFLFKEKGEMYTKINIVARTTCFNLVIEYFRFTWPTMKKAIAYEYECTVKHKCQHLLRVAKSLFSQASTDYLNSKV